MSQNEFIKTTLPFEDNLFNELSNNINFENVGKGRLVKKYLLEKNIFPIHDAYQLVYKF